MVVCLEYGICGRVWLLVCCNAVVSLLYGICGSEFGIRPGLFFIYVYTSKLFYTRITGLFLGTAIQPRLHTTHTAYSPYCTRTFCEEVGLISHLRAHRERFPSPRITGQPSSYRQTQRHTGNY